MHERRWDNDMVGHGIGNAAAAAPDMRRLLEASSAPDWVAEQPEVHVLPALNAALEASGELRLSSSGVDATGSLVVDVEWAATAHPSPGAVRAAVYRVLAGVAELSTYVQEHPGPEFTVLTGILDGDTAWRGHGHLLRVRVRPVGAAPANREPAPGPPAGGPPG